MADISKCANKECPSRLSCYRYLAEDGYYQTYGSFQVPENEDKCDYYWHYACSDEEE